MIIFHFLFFFCSLCPKNHFQTLSFFSCIGVGGALWPWGAHKAPLWSLTNIKRIATDITHVQPTFCSVQPIFRMVRPTSACPRPMSFGLSKRKIQLVVFQRKIHDYFQKVWVRATLYLEMNVYCSCSSYRIFECIELAKKLGTWLECGQQSFLLAVFV